MKKLRVDGAETFIAAIEGEVSHTHSGRYRHRSRIEIRALEMGDCCESAHIYSHFLVSVYDWLHRLTQGGLDGLREVRRTGRPCNNSASQKNKLLEMLSDNQYVQANLQRKALNKQHIRFP